MMDVWTKIIIRFRGMLENGVFTATNDEPAHGSAMIQFSVAAQGGFYTGNPVMSIDGTQ